MKRPINLQQNPDQSPVSKLVFVQSIRDIGAVAARFKSGGLNERALICLLADHSGVSKTTCREVVNSLKQLEKAFTE